MAVTRKPLADYLSERIWQPLGMEDDASWALDGAGASELPYCCLNARLRDLARLGQFMLDGGRIGDKQVLAKGFVAQATRAHHRQLAPGMLYPSYPLGYGDQWWLMPGDDGAYAGHGARALKELASRALSRYPSRRNSPVERDDT